MNLRLTLAGAVATLLTSIVLYPLYVSGLWFWEGAGAIIAVAAGATLARRFAMPAAVCLLASLLALLLYLNGLFAGPQSLLGAVPTPSSLAQLGHRASQGWVDIGAYAAPVPLLPGIAFLNAIGIGAVAAVVDLLAARLRRAAVAGLPLLALFSVPVATRDAQLSLISFAVGATGYLILLLADGRERVSRWGRLVTLGRSQPEGPQAQDAPVADARALTATGRRIGLTAVILALFVPLLVPSLKVRNIFSGSPGSGGGTAASFPDPVDRLSRQLRETSAQPVLTYTTKDLAPQYLRVYVLDLDDTTWTLTSPLADPSNSRAGGSLPPPPGFTAQGISAPQSTEQITVKPNLSNTRYLPLPYPSTNVGIAGDWRVNPSTLMVFSSSDSAAGRSYQATSLNVNPSSGQLRSVGRPPADIETRYTAVPPAFAQIKAIADRETRGATTEYDKAMALQNWFTTSGTFKYDLKASVTDDPAGLYRFLSVTKKGYCQQFAFAMAVMARMVGIPARVAVGYTQGTRQGNHWVVSTSDAHAWPELYFAGVGWLRFEPTPVGGVGQATGRLPQYTLPTLGTPGPGLGTLGTPQTTPNAPGAGQGLNPTAGPRGRIDPGGAAGSGKASAGGGPTTVEIALVAAVLLSLLAPRAARSLTRRRRWLAARDDVERAHAAWREFRDDLADHGLAMAANQSPRTAARRLGQDVEFAEAAQDALTRIARAQERALYARSPETAGNLQADSTLVRRAVAAWASPATRWRARLFPPSTLTPLRRMAHHALDMFGWMDVTTSWMRSRLIGGKGRAQRESA